MCLQTRICDCLQEGGGVPCTPESEAEWYRFNYKRRAPARLREVEKLKRNIAEIDEQTRQKELQLKSLLPRAPQAVTSAAMLLPRRQRQQILRGSILPVEHLLQPPVPSEQHSDASSSSELAAVKSQLMVLRAEYNKISASAREAERQRLKGHGDPSGSQGGRDERSGVVTRDGSSDSAHDGPSSFPDSRQSQRDILKRKITSLTSRLRELKKAAAPRRSSPQPSSSSSVERKQAQAEGLTFDPERLSSVTTAAAAAPESPPSGGCSGSINEQREMYSAQCSGTRQLLSRFSGKVLPRVSTDTAAGTGCLFGNAHIRQERRSTFACSCKSVVSRGCRSVT